MANRATAVALPDGRLPETRHVDVTTSDPAALRARIQELETLCAEVYVAAVELGFPQQLLNHLWTVAAHGRTPHAFALEMPPRPVAVPPPESLPGSVAVPSSGAVLMVAPVMPPDAPEHAPPRMAEARQIPDIKLSDRPLGSRDGEPRAKTAAADLKPLATRRTVLVVDDDPMMLEVLVRILARENYELLTASSGPDALQKVAAQQGAIDLLITDYAMPDMKGSELADKMREGHREIRVLYQTGFSDMLFEDRMELEEGSAFLEKPFTARGLREAARFILFGAINPA